MDKDWCRFHPVLSMDEDITETISNKGQKSTLIKFLFHIHSSIQRSWKSIDSHFQNLNIKESNKALHSTKGSKTMKLHIFSFKHLIPPFMDFSSLSYL